MLLATLRCSVLTGLIAALSASLPPQQQGQCSLGPSHPDSGLPVYVEDARGLRLGPIDTAAFCSTGVGAVQREQPVVYWSMSGSMFAAGARGNISCFIEGIPEGATADAGPRVVSRLSLAFAGLVDGATYSIRHPYGLDRLIAGVHGPLPGTIRHSVEVPVGDPSASMPFAVPADFVADGTRGQWVGDGTSMTRIRGGRDGVVSMRIEGPGIGRAFPAHAQGDDVVELAEFVITGRVASQIGASIDRVCLSRSDLATTIDVWANSVPGQQLRVLGADGLTVPMRGDRDGGYYSRLVLEADAPVPTAVRLQNLADDPMVEWSKSAVDAVQVHRAELSAKGALHIVASSTDTVGDPQFSVEIPGVGVRPLTVANTGVVEDVIWLPEGVLPPRSVTVRSSRGGRIEALVLLDVPSLEMGSGRGLAEGLRAPIAVADPEPVATQPAAVPSAMVELPAEEIPAEEIPAEEIPAEEMPAEQLAVVAPPVEELASPTPVPVSVPVSFPGPVAVEQPTAEPVAEPVPVPAPSVTAVAGDDTKSAPGSFVMLNGMSSKGDIVAVRWSIEGAVVQLEDADSLTPFFTVPNLPGGVLLCVLEVEGSDGSLDRDSVRVAVEAR